MVGARRRTDPSLHVGIRTLDRPRTHVMFKLQSNHAHSVCVSLAPETLSLLERFLPKEEPEEPAPSVEPCHVVPLLKLLYEQAHSEDWLSSPTAETTVNREWYVAFHRFRTLLDSIGVRLLFPQDLNPREVRVDQRIDSKDVLQPELVQVLSPGLYRSVNATVLEPAQVVVCVPVELEAVVA